MYLNVNKLESSVHTYSTNTLLPLCWHIDTRTRSAIFLRNKVLPMRRTSTPSSSSLSMASIVRLSFFFRKQRLQRSICIINYQSSFTIGEIPQCVFKSMLKPIRSSDDATHNAPRIKKNPEYRLPFLWLSAVKWQTMKTFFFYSHSPNDRSHKNETIEKE